MRIERITRDQAVPGDAFYSHIYLAITSLLWHFTVYDIEVGRAKGYLNTVGFQFVDEEVFSFLAAEDAGGHVRGVPDNLGVLDPFKPCRSIHRIRFGGIFKSRFRYPEVFVFRFILVFRFIFVGGANFSDDHRWFCEDAAKALPPSY